MLLYPALLLLINKLHIFKSHLLPSVCQLYKLGKISGREREGCCLCSVQSLMASGRQLAAPTERGGAGRVHSMGCPTRVLPHLQLLP